MLLIVIIGVALAAFVLGDIFQNPGRRTMPPLAEINGERIQPDEFRRKVEDFENRYRQQKQGAELTQQERFQAMEDAWNDLLRAEILVSQAEALGLAVSHSAHRQPSISSAELIELITGPTPHPIIRQIPVFQDEQTGRFMPERAIQFISILDQQDPETQRQWYDLEQDIKRNRLEDKYYNLIKKGYYIPGPLAQEFHNQQRATSSAMIAGVRFRDVPDTEVQLTDEDFERFYQEHKHEFKIKEPRAEIRYVTFRVNPSPRDYSQTLDEARDLFEEFRRVDLEDASLIANTVGTSNYDSLYFKRGELEPRIDTALFDAEPGAMVPVYEEGGAFHMARLMEVDYRPDSMRASHILINHQRAFRGEQSPRNYEEAESLADSLYQVVRQNPAMFEQLAATQSDDQMAAENMGDLDWFADGDMVYPFNEGVINHDVGEIFQVESPFGFHVVRVTGKKEPVRKVRVARVTIPIEPSQATDDSVYNDASVFAGSYRSREAFLEGIKENEMSARERVIRPMEGHIPGIGSAREIARWAFDEDTKEGQVADNLFRGDDTYVVVLLESRIKEGVQPLENVRERIQSRVMREAKAQTLRQQFIEAMDNESQIGNVARKMGLEIDTVDNISFAMTNIPRVGPEPALVGVISRAPENVLTGPVKGNIGMYVFQVIRHTPAPETQNFMHVISQRKRQFENLVGSSQHSRPGKALEALKEASNIEDNRILYY